MGMANTIEEDRPRIAYCMQIYVRSATSVLESANTIEEVRPRIAECLQSSVTAAAEGPRPTHRHVEIQVPEIGRAIPKSCGNPSSASSGRTARRRRPKKGTTRSRPRFHEGLDDVAHGRLKRRDIQRGHRTAGCNNVPWLAGRLRSRLRHKFFKLLT